MKKYLPVALALSAIILPLAAGAATFSEPGVNTGSFTSVQGIINFLTGTIMGWIKAIFWFLVAIMIMYAAFKYLTAGGDPDKVKEATGILKYAVVGIAVALLVTVLPTLVASFIGGQ